ncbi:MAG: hypothetical protein Q8R39_04715 [bacterium]|nr:hypothetical protein [bacterium]MDZ4285035.1 hypothetical protein [Patescibacteria group bacterium]
MLDLTTLTYEEKLAVTAEVLEGAAKHGIIPEDPVWSAYQKAVAQAYVEVLLVKKAEGVWNFFLKKRGSNDTHFPGEPWHIPGGIWRTPWTLEQACQEVARREVGVDIDVIVELKTRKWFDHPYGFPISHICICCTNQPLHETSRQRFFPYHDREQTAPLTHWPPNPIVPPHRQFVHDAAEYLSSLQKHPRGGAEVMPLSYVLARREDFVGGGIQLHRNVPNFRGLIENIDVRKDSGSIRWLTFYYRSAANDTAPYSYSSCGINFNECIDVLPEGRIRCRTYADFQQSWREELITLFPKGDSILDGFLGGERAAAL